MLSKFLVFYILQNSSFTKKKMRRHLHLKCIFLNIYNDIYVILSIANIMLVKEKKYDPLASIIMFFFCLFIKSSASICNMLSYFEFVIY